MRSSRRQKNVASCLVATHSDCAFEAPRPRYLFALSLSLDTVEKLSPFRPVLVRVLRREVPLVPLHLRNTILLENIRKPRNTNVVHVFKFGAVGNNSRHHGNRVLLRRKDVAALNGARVLVSRHANTDGHIGTETKAALSNLGVPGEQVGSGEVVEARHNGSAVLVGVDNVGRITYAC
jgi:hypothetical protein